ncbi:MAG: NDP-hexose 2,3-dehydratase family protein [Candidatus Riflebacteria bacterium]|nr:NDP-hexose 2,3-dehydratase family protein [Candidatus Riflebacteria bacterium]
MVDDSEILMLRSALTVRSPFGDCAAALAWVESRRGAVPAEIQTVPWSSLRSWRFESDTGNLVHESGRFYTIEGIHVRTNWGFVPEWDQPIIVQPEVGVLGIIGRQFDGVLHFLLQAKIEPGNIDGVQLAPTFQATRSNYTRVHGGKRPRYAEYFLDPCDRRVHLDVLQSEQGSRFLRKRNRNIIIEARDELEVAEDFRWLTLGQILELLRRDNLVNMDTRTIVSCISFGSYSREAIGLCRELVPRAERLENGSGQMLLSALEGERHRHTIAEIISWITGLKTRYDLSVDRMPLARVRAWQRDECAIFHEARKYFSVIAVEASIGNREVRSWCQPMLRSAQVGIIAFLIKLIGGVYHFLVQAKLEAGNLDIIELAPTVQCVNDNYRHSKEEQKPAYLDYVLQVKPEQILYDALQSEEGGRFYREQNRNMLIEVEGDFDERVPETYLWMTLNQIKLFIHFNNYFNVEARSLIASIRFR